MGSPPGRHLSQQALKEMPCPARIFRMQKIGLWKHMPRPISFTLVVNNFGVKYERKEDIDHLIKCTKQKYELTKDWDGDLYCGVCLKWDYLARTLDISMLGYTIKQLHQYKHASPAKPQHCPYSPHNPNNMAVRHNAPSPRTHLLPSQNTT